MCGRFHLTTSSVDVADAFGALQSCDIPPSYNVAPSHVSPILCSTKADGVVLAPAQWGLKRPGSETSARLRLLINARLETAATLPTFRRAFDEQRCIVPATGYIEWRKRPNQPGVPYNVAPTSDPLLWLAGLWFANPGDRGTRHRFVILTESSTHELAHLHRRMPLIFNQAEARAWINMRLGGRREDFANRNSRVRLSPTRIAHHIGNVGRNHASLLHPIAEGTGETVDLFGE